jgi:hypothetical protein
VLVPVVSLRTNSPDGNDVLLTGLVIKLVCIGMHLARMELRMAVALFFRTFPHAVVSHLEDMSDADMAQEIYFLLSPKGKRCLIQAS